MIPSKIDDGVWCLNYPLTMLGMDLGRRVTIFRLSSGEVVIHSTAPFQNEEVEAIHGLGEPIGLIDATNFHDTYSQVGRAAFPDCEYRVPPGFPKADSLDAQQLLPPPPNWEGELEIFKIRGMPSLNEHAVYHRPSRTLIVADLIFNLSPDRPAWTRVGLRLFSGLKTAPSASRLFKLCVRDRDAFSESIRELAALDVKRIIPAHGLIIEESTEAVLRRLYPRCFRDAQRAGS